MRINHLVLFMVNLLALCNQPSTAISWRLRQWRGLLMLSKDQCYNRCLRKHGYFKDGTGEYQHASVAKRYVLKCQCMVSRQLKAYITARFGEKVATHYGYLNFYGREGKGRLELQGLAESAKTPPIVFITYEDLVRLTEKQKAAELGRQATSGRQEKGGAGAGAGTGMATATGGTSGTSGSTSTLVKPPEVPEMQLLPDIMIQKYGEDGKPLPGQEQKLQLSPEDSAAFNKMVMEIIRKQKTEASKAETAKANH